MNGYERSFRDRIRTLFLTASVSNLVVIPNTEKTGSEWPSSG